MMHVVRSPNRIYRRLSESQRREAVALWCAGRDTFDIARALGVPECDVANDCPRILESYRTTKYEVPA